ncbi:MAG: AAA family ATPase [Rhodocyclaceae bacterium]|nr:AAA family ATPase [Rhodocyclaceae bacterium]MBX3667908.1 AAA family ATPase [Rhodocyclaceae bacterium]
MIPELDYASQKEMVRALAAALARSAPVECVETHISWVLLAGRDAYKIKKALDLGFLDFRSRAARAHYCAEELRLNRRTAPDLYLEVVGLGGTPAAPAIATAPAFDYAVRMRRFERAQVLDALAAAGRLRPEHIDALAETVARFHAGTAAAGMDEDYGSPASIAAPVRQNFVQIAALLQAPTEREQLARCEDWAETSHAALAPIFAARRQAGFVRECHGDLHLGNVVLLDGRPTPFDCLEFDPALRWDDVMSDVAFLVMDLHTRGQPQLAARLLDRYLAATGDYAGLAVLDYYLAYRAMVRAKVELLSAGRPCPAATAYLHYAFALTQPRRGGIVITHGFSGSGKTTRTAALVEQLGALRLRSDLERKRLYGYAPLARPDAAAQERLYSRSAGLATYERLAELARTVLASGRIVIVDATFLRAAERQRFRDLARETAVGFAILDCVGPPELLKQRLEQRKRAAADASDADLAVLDRQLADHDPLLPDECALAVRADAAEPLANGLAPQADAKLRCLLGLKPPE